MIKRILAVLLLTATAFATTTVSGNIKDLSGTAVSKSTFVRFWLRGCSGNQPRINGTALIAPSQGNVFYFDVVPNSSGVVSGTLYSTRDAAGTGNGEIECGGVFTGVWYGMQVYVKGKGGPETAVHAKNGATIDISNVTAISTNPVVTAPTGDSTYARLDGGNTPFTGNVSFTGTSSATGGGTISGGFTASIGKLNNRFILDGAKYAQNDTGLHSAATDCVTQNGGFIIIPSGVTVSQTTALTLGNNVAKPQCTLVIDPGGVLQVNVTGGVDAILLGDGSGLYGSTTTGTTGTVKSSMVQLTATTNINALFAPLDRTGAQEGLTIKDIYVHGTCSATIASAIFDIQGVFVGTRITGVFTDAIPSKIARLRGGTSVPHNESDVLIDGNLDATGCAGGEPISIEGSATSNIGGVTFLGQAQHAGATLPIINIDGGGQTTSVISVHFGGAYHIETVNTPATCQVKIADANQISFNQLTVSGPTATSLACISQTVANATHDIEIRHVRTSAAWTNVINNTVPTPAYTSGSDVESYVYGDGSAGAAGGGGIVVFHNVPFQVIAKEAAAPTGAATGYDLLYPDSTAHRWKMNNNNAGAVQVVASGVDINTSDQVTQAHLGSETQTAAPRYLWSTYMNGAVTTNTYGSFIPDKAITVTRIDVSWITASANCTVAPTISVTDGTNLATLTVANSTVQQTATFTQNYAGGTRLNLNAVAGTCTTQPNQTMVNVEYKMQ